MTGGSNPKGKTVFVSIVGDLFHVGHLQFLQKARSFGDYLIVGVLTDDVVASYKRKPIIPEGERLELIASQRCVDEVHFQYDLDPEYSAFKTFRLEEADVIVHGDDWPGNFPGAEYMRSIGKEAINVPYYHQQSTTKIIEEIRRRFEKETSP